MITTRVASITPAEAKIVLTSFIERSLSSEPSLRGGIPEAVYRIHKCIGSRSALARLVNTTHSTISQMESGAIKRGSPSLLSKLAIQARQLGLSSTAEYLETQSLIASSDQRQKGGRR